MDVQRLTEIARIGSFIFGGLAALLAIDSATRIAKTIARRKTKTNRVVGPIATFDSAPDPAPVIRIRAADMANVHIFPLGGQRAMQVQEALSTEITKASIQIEDSKTPSAEKTLEKAHA